MLRVPASAMLRIHWNPFYPYLVVVDFDDVKDDEQREMLKEIPTSFSLTPEQVAALRQAGKQLLQDSVAYQQFLNDMK